LRHYDRSTPLGRRNSPIFSGRSALSGATSVPSNSPTSSNSSASRKTSRSVGCACGWSPRGAPVARSAEVSHSCDPPSPRPAVPNVARPKQHAQQDHVEGNDDGHQTEKILALNPHSSFGHRRRAPGPKRPVEKQRFCSPRKRPRLHCSGEQRTCRLRGATTRMNNSTERAGISAADHWIRSFIASKQFSTSDGGPTTRIVLRQHTPSDPCVVLSLTLSQRVKHNTMSPSLSPSANPRFVPVRQGAGKPTA
jgi:hypothetical protein